MQKINIISFLLFLYRLNLIKLTCIPNENCPKENGECIKNECICFEEFYSLKNKINPKKENIFCEYRKMSRFGPLILEFFLPTIGHLYAGKMNLFFAKLFFIFFPLIGYFCGLTDNKPNPDGTPKIISTCNWILLILLISSSVILPFFHIIDLICYSFGIYRDGNGVPFISFI